MTLFAGMKIEEFYSVNYVEKTGSADTQIVEAHLQYKVDSVM